MELMDLGVTNMIRDNIQQAKNEGDQLALMIHKVKVDSMKVIVNLKNEEGEVFQTTIDLKMNAQQNATIFYEKRKKLIEKEKKTKGAIEDALKKAKVLAEKEI